MSSWNMPVPQGAKKKSIADLPTTAAPDHNTAPTRLYGRQQAWSTGITLEHGKSGLNRPHDLLPSLLSPNIMQNDAVYIYLTDKWFS